MATPHWSNYLETSDKDDKWLPDEKVITPSGWGNHTTTLVLSTPLAGNTIARSHQGSPEMIPVNPKDLLTPLPMDVDTYIYRNNQVSQTLEH